MDLAQLTKEEFDAHLANNTLRLAFVGMSNVGKSYRARVLRDENAFKWYCVDEQILSTLGFKSMDEISAWLGLPHTKNYSAREKTYLEAEDSHTKVDFLDTERKNLVFDTTGSVIYLNEATLRWLKDHCLTVNIDTEESSFEEMVRKVAEQPKPLVWSGYYDMKEGETEKATIERCYPKLLSDRLKKYREMAHVTIPVHELFDTTGDETLKIIRSHLP